MHASWFSYSVTKPDPFRWFTPVTIVGGIILVVIVTLLQIASNSFYVRTSYTSDPNGTAEAANERWFMSPFFNWQANLDVSCEPQTLSVGDRFFTTNLGLRYEVAEIYRMSSQQIKIPLPSVPYLNNTLEKCEMGTVNLNLNKGDASPPPSWWISWVKSHVQAFATCELPVEPGTVKLTLHAQYTARDDQIYDYVLADQFKTAASMWWATRLLNAYWSGVLTMMAHVPEQNSSIINHAQFSFTRLMRPLPKDIRSTDFFNTRWWFSTEDSKLISSDDVTNTNTPILNNPSNNLSPPVTEGYYFARLLHSLVVADLGNCALPNLLTPDNLAYAILPPDDMNRKAGGVLNSTTALGSARFANIPEPFYRGNKSVPLNESYIQLVGPGMGPLTCSNATIKFQYMCSVPQPRPWGTILFAIVLADLVFLQAAWKIMNWIATGVVVNRDRQAMVCQGCGRAHNAGYSSIGGTGYRGLHGGADTDSEQLLDGKHDPGGDVGSLRPVSQAKGPLG